MLAVEVSLIPSLLLHRVGSLGQTKRPVLGSVAPMS